MRWRESIYLGDLIKYGYGYVHIDNVHTVGKIYTPHTSLFWPKSFIESNWLLVKGVTRLKLLSVLLELRLQHRPDAILNLGGLFCKKSIGNHSGSLNVFSLAWYILTINLFPRCMQKFKSMQFCCILSVNIVLKKRSYLLN